MQQQNYKNYRKYYIPHHFIFLPMLMVFTVYGISKVYNDATNKLVWQLFSISCFSILFLGLMVRQHYALGNQNRIVRLEFRLRYFELFGESGTQVEEKLSFAQIAALRFAGDKEFKYLLDQAINKHFNSEDIKKSITKWKADNMRV